MWHRCGTPTMYLLVEELLSCRNGGTGCSPFGHHPYPGKAWPVVKPERRPTPEAQFEGTGVNITTHGQRHLGSRPFAEEFVKKVSVSISEIECLSDIGKAQPQAAYAVLTHGLMNEWTVLMRTIPVISDLFHDLTLRKRLMH